VQFDAVRGCPFSWQRPNQWLRFSMSHRQWGPGAREEDGVHIGHDIS
jgi:hypothetical protein